MSNLFLKNRKVLIVKVGEKIYLLHTKLNGALSIAQIHSIIIYRLQI